MKSVGIFTTLAYRGKVLSVTGRDDEIGRVRAVQAEVVYPELFPRTRLRGIGVQHIGGHAAAIDRGQIISVRRLESLVVRWWRIQHCDPESLPRSGRRGRGDDGWIGR